MANLGSLFYTLDIKDLTQEQLSRVQNKLKNLGAEITVTPVVNADALQRHLPKGVKFEVTPTITNEALQKAAEGKVMQVAIKPLVTELRNSIKSAFNGAPAEVDIAANASILRQTIQSVLTRQGFIVNINTASGEYLRNIQTQLDGRAYQIRVFANVRTLVQNIQSAMANMTTRSLGLKVAKDVLRNSIDAALGSQPFNIQIQISKTQARNAVQSALNNASNVTSTDALKYQRLQSGELAAARTELTKLKAEHLRAAGAADVHTRASLSLGSAMGSNIRISGELTSAMASLYSVHAIKEFLANVVEIGGELEHQKIAMNTIFGDTGKTTQLFGQIKDLARNSPFGVMELTKSVKSLSAYGVKYNEIYDTAKRLADISAATSVDINRLILAYGKTKSRGFLDGLEAKQFAYANIPIYEMVRKKLEELEGQAITTAEVMSRIRKKEIGFDIVKDVLWDITDPGGQFSGMQEQLAGSLKTSWKLIKDNMDLMFGEMADSGVGNTLKWIAELLQSVTRNWKTLGNELLIVAAAYGVHKMAAMLNVGALGKLRYAELASMAASNQDAVYKAQLASVYRELTVEETQAQLATVALNKARSNSLFATKTLSNLEVKRLYNAKLLTKDLALQMLATGKLNAASTEWLIKVGLITEAEKQYIIQTQKFSGRLGLLYNRLRILGTELKHSFVTSLLPMIKSPLTWITAGVMGFMALQQRNSRELEKSKEIGDKLFEGANEGAKSLAQTIKEIGDNIEKLSGVKLRDAIDKLENAIKDYSPNADKVLREARVDNGKVRTEQEYAKALQEEVAALEKANDLGTNINIGEIVQKAVDKNNGFLTDDLNTKLDNYVKSYKSAEQEVNDFVKKYPIAAKGIVKVAEESDTAFANAAQGLGTYAAKFELLTRNINRFTSANNAIYRKMYMGGKKPRYADAWSNVLDSFSIDVNHDFNSYKSELTDVMADIKQALNTAGIEVGQGVDMSKPVQIMLAKAANTLFESAKSLPQEYQDQIYELWNNFFGLSFDDSALFGSVAENAKKGLSQALATGHISKELADKLTSGAAYNDLSDAEKEVVRKLIEDSADETKKKMPHLTNVIQQKLNDANFIASITLSLAKYADLEDWKQDLIRKAGGNPTIEATIKATTDIASLESEIQSLYKKTKESLKNLGGLNIGISLTPGKKIDTSKITGFNLFAPSKKKMIEEYNDLIDIINSADALGKDMGFNPNAKEKNKTQKDKVAEAMQQRFKDIKDAWSAYNSLQKQIGDDAAFQRVSESGLFSTLKSDQLPTSVEAYRKLITNLRSDLEKAGVKGHNQRENLLNEIIKQLFDIDNSQIKEQISVAMQEVTRTAEQELNNWNIYDKLYKATGNESLAKVIAFGGNGTTDYIQLIKKQFNEAAIKVKDKVPDSNLLFFDNITAENATKLPEELQKRWEEATNKIATYANKQRDEVADILQSYQTLQDQIDAIESKRQRDLATVERKDKNGNYIIADEGVRNSKSQAINAQADWDIFTKQSEYTLFFNNIYALTVSSANRIGDAIQLNLNKKLQSGLITIYEYEQEMEKVRKQVEAVRNIKSDTMTYLTGGIKGYNDKRLAKEEGNLATNPEYQAALQKQLEAQNALTKAQEEGNQATIDEAQAALDSANEQVEAFTKVRDAIIQNQKAWENFANVTAIASNVAQGLSDAYSSIKDMATALGADTDSDTWDNIGALVDTLNAVTSGIDKFAQSAVKGDIGGMLSGAVSIITKPFTIWSELHDKKLQKDIEASQKYAQQLKNIYSRVGEQIEYALGSGRNVLTDDIQSDINSLQKYTKLANKAGANSAKYSALAAKYQARVDAYNKGGAYGYQRQLLTEQLDELERQKADAENMKNKSEEDIEQYTEDIAELKQQILEYAEETANTLYGIDFTSWAESIGDSLVSAFAEGTDAAEAFDDAVTDILQSLVSKMVSVDIVEPLMSDLRQYLFGEDGTGGVFDDFELTANEIAGMKPYIEKIRQGVSSAQELWDAVDEAWDGQLSDSGDTTTVSQSIQGVTEDTADLLASYMNAIRADVSLATNVYWVRLLDESMPKVNQLAQAQLEVQQQIAYYTYNISETAVTIEGLLRRATQDSSNGFYMR